MDIEAMEKMLARGPDNLLLRFGLGTAYLQRHEPAKAIPHLRAAVAFDARHAAAWKLLGQALAADGQPDAARAVYTEGIRQAEAHGHIQAAREMRVFCKRLDKKPS
ncbi:MAG: tetratricopeptide repeat protein [Acidiferrobacter sp.]